jgi:hypothetical protein
LGCLVAAGTHAVATEKELEQLALPRHKRDLCRLPDNICIVENAGGRDCEGRVLGSQGHEFELDRQIALASEWEGSRALVGWAGNVDADAVHLGRHAEIAPHTNHDLGVVLTLAARGQRYDNCQ